MTMDQVGQLVELALEGYVTTGGVLSPEHIASPVIAGKGKRFAVEMSDDTATTSAAWGVRVWELQHEAGRGEVRSIRVYNKLATRENAIARLRAVVDQVRQQVGR